MNISFVQIYIKPGISFPFSYVMQQWLGEQVSSLAGSALAFSKKYGPDFDLGFNISTDTEGPLEARVEWTPSGLLRVLAIDNHRIVASALVTERELSDSVKGAAESALRICRQKGFWSSDADTLTKELSINAR